MPTMESRMTTSMTIGQIARAADVGVETVRFYEREGLIAEPPRRMSGYRQFPPETVDQLRFIKRAKALGFALKELARALSKLWVGPGNLISGSIAAGATWGIGEAAIAYFIDGASKKQARRVFRERMSDQPPGADPSDGVVDEGPDAIGPDTEAPDKSW